MFSKREKAANQLREAVALFDGRWRLRILFDLFGGKERRFNELERRIGISQKVLTQQLRALERDGLVKRTVFPEVPPRVQYSLTPWGQSLCPTLDSLWNWHQQKPVSEPVDLPRVAVER